MKMNEKIRNMTIGLFCAATVSILLTGCGSGEATKQSAAADDSLDTIIEKAKEEGEIASLGMPGSLKIHECLLRRRQDFSIIK